jgi:hypothetical protein
LFNALRAPKNSWLGIAATDPLWREAQKNQFSIAIFKVSPNLSGTLRLCVNQSLPQQGKLAAGYQEPRETPRVTPRTPRKGFQSFGP